MENNILDRLSFNHYHVEIVDSDHFKRKVYGVVNTATGVIEMESSILPQAADVARQLDEDVNELEQEILSWGKNVVQFEGNTQQ